MLALPLRLPTAPYGGHMGHFLLSTLILAGSTPFGNTSYFLQLYIVLHRQFTGSPAPAHRHRHRPGDRDRCRHSPTVPVPVYRLGKPYGTETGLV